MRGILLALLLVLAVPAAARDLTAPEKAALAETVASFNAAMEIMDMERVVATIPPRVFDRLAEAYGMEVEALRAQIVAESAETMAQIDDFVFDMDLDAAEYHATPDGTPYVLIPTETEFAIDSQRLRADGPTLAILDEGMWYLLRVSEQAQVNILRAVYPAFAEVPLPEGRIEIME